MVASLAFRFEWSSDSADTVVAIAEVHWNPIVLLNAIVAPDPGFWRLRGRPSTSLRTVLPTRAATMATSLGSRTVIRGVRGGRHSTSAKHWALRLRPCKDRSLGVSCERRQGQHPQRRTLRVS